MVFSKKEKEVDELLLQHFSRVQETLEEFQKMMLAYLQSDRIFKAEAFKVHQLECQADQLRRSIGQKVAEGAFLPIYREDYLKLIERVDAVANLAEETSDFLVSTRPQIPDFLKEQLCELLQTTLETYYPVLDLLKAFQNNQNNMIEVAKRVQDKEHQVDRLVWEMTKKLFKSEVDYARKLHLKMVIDRISGIADIVEHAVDCFEVMVAKRNL